MRATLSAALAAIVLSAMGCGEDAPPPTFPVTFLAKTDDRPLPGVTITIANRPVGVTQANGEVALRLPGEEGAHVAYTAQCPAGYRQPAAVPPLTLRRFQGLDPSAQARGIEVSIVCPPAQRSVAVVVRTGQPNLPVTMQGQQVAVTDPGGVAHVLVRLEPNSAFRVALDTTTSPNLRPQNPSMAFSVPDADEIFLFDPQFEVEDPSCPRGTRRNRDGNCVRIVRRQAPTVQLPSCVGANCRRNR